MSMTEETGKQLVNAINMLRETIDEKMNAIHLPSPITPKSALKADTNEVDSIVKATQLFPENLEKMLKFSLIGDVVHLQPKSFLGSEYFAKIASIVTGVGGEYISAGKLSHFEIKEILI